ncbi:MAG: bifunctional nuclease family protein [Prolixibacteraceae bacterium]|nr:bifunctional nuclease family protein [Prolixibacteraceae bacterium]
MQKIKLEITGLTVSQVQSGAYALILGEAMGDRRLPIIIGPVEAQAIAIQLEGLQPPRPLTHDLIKNMADVFGINLLEVMIYKLSEGIFFSELKFEKDGEIVRVDSRTSDAVALSLRFDSPIFTTDEILHKAGVVLGTENEEFHKADDVPTWTTGKSYYKNYTLSELQDMLSDAIENEDYEKASFIRDEIYRRKK